MEISKSQVLKNAIDDVKKRTGLNDNEIKRIFINEYILEDDEQKEAMQKLANFLKSHKKR